MKKMISGGFYPFWFWNDYVTEEEICWQVREMADKGVKGFFIHPRQGLKQPYLSEAFFQMMDVATSAAEDHGLVANLYDEYPYPSGIAGGEVILGNPQFYATTLVQRSYQIDGGKIRLELAQGKVLSAVAYPIKHGETSWSDEIDLKNYVGMVLVSDSYIETGLTAYNQKRYFASNPTPVLEVSLPKQQYIIYVSIQATVRHFKYWHNYVDILNKDAVKSFLQLTHDRYKMRYADKFGDSLLCIFTDEVYPRWSNLIPDAFLKEYGYDLCEYMPALQDQCHPKHLQVSYDLYKLRQKMFYEAFEKPVSAWCHSNGLAYCGEKPSFRLSQLRFMDIPGCQPGHIRAGADMDLISGQIRDNAKATASATYFYDKPGSLCECYHSIGWGGTLQDAKLIAEGLLLLGVDYMVPHGFFYCTHALRKHDAPPSFFFQMPFWTLFDRLSERLELIGSLFTDTYIDANVLVIDPNSGLPSEDELDVYVEIQNMLLANHMDFHIVDTDILEDATIDNSCIRVKDVLAKVLIVPPMRIVEQPLRIWIDEYQKMGGYVIFCEKEFQPDQFLHALKLIVKPSLSVRCKGKEIPSIWVVKRVSSRRTLWFVLNTSNKQFDAELVADAHLREVVLEPSMFSQLKYENGNYERTIRPFESFMLEATGMHETIQDMPKFSVNLSGEAKLELKDKNLLRMYQWQMSILDEAGSKVKSAVVPAVPLSSQLKKGQFSFAPRIYEYFGDVPELHFPELHVCYEYSFDNNYCQSIELIMEPGSIIGDWSISINDSDVLVEEDFAPTETHIRGSVGRDITESLKQGRNVICVNVTTDKSSGGLLNCLYLAGDFGVVLKPLTLVLLEKCGEFEQYESNLIPYYSGVIEYTTEFYIDSVPKTDYVVLEFTYDCVFQEASEVSINGNEFQPVLWEPRNVVISSDCLREGSNQLRTRVHTSLLRSLEGA